MQAFPPHPTYWGKPVVIRYDPGVKRAKIIDAGFHGLVRRMETTGSSQDELLVRIHVLATEYGLVARILSITQESIEFVVSRQ